MTDSLLGPALVLPALAFEGVVRARNALYTQGLLRTRRLPRPVCSVGNLTLGGTGKTPLVVYLVRRLAELGFEPAVLTRGHGRRDPRRHWLVAPGSVVDDAALELGDEPALLRRALPEAWLGVDRDRFRAGLEISRRAPRAVFVLDDGFQHRRLARDLDLVVVDATQPLASNRIAPRGTLREPLAGLSRADAVLVQGDARYGAEIEDLVGGLAPGARLLRFRHAIRSFTPLASWRERREEPADPGPAAFLVAAVGNPARFRSDVGECGIDVRGARFYRDHHSITPAQWRAAVEEARRSGAPCIVTTAKDAIKLARPPDYPLLVAEQSTEFAQPGAFDSLVRERLGGAAR